MSKSENDSRLNAITTLVGCIVILVHVVQIAIVLRYQTTTYFQKSENTGTSHKEPLFCIWCRDSLLIFQSSKKFPAHMSSTRATPLITWSQYNFWRTWSMFEVASCAQTSFELAKYLHDVPKFVVAASRQRPRLALPKYSQSPAPTTPQ